MYSHRKSILKPFCLNSSVRVYSAIMRGTPWINPNQKNWLPKVVPLRDLVETIKGT